MRFVPAAPPLLLACATLFGATVFGLSWWQWWTFKYTTFDLAFYVQALWLALRGQWQVSLLDVPLLGNHAEPIVFLAAPLFALCPHPMLLVALQTLALATMPFTAWRIAHRLALDRRAAGLLALAVVLTPATGFVALHEFHPEALAAPLLLLLIEARLAQRLTQFWLWFLAVLACKENLALLLVAWAIVHGISDWRRPWRWQLQWNALPLAAAFTWFAVYARVLSPVLNPGNVDYLELYSHLGRSISEIGHTLFTQPRRGLGAVVEALQGGNLVWGLLLPFLALPLLRPHWLVIAAPVLFQHLLSWRPSEWSIEAHYAAPLIPLFWIAAAEALTKARLQWVGAILVVVACIIAQMWMGPTRSMVRELRFARERLAERRWKAELLSTIPAQASVTAGLPYLSHLATRTQLHSLHHVLKGLKTLSRAAYVPPAGTDAVVVDYADAATFSPPSGYYHPPMRTADSRIVPSSDRLLHEFLRQSTWGEQSRNAFHVYTRGGSIPDFTFEPTRLRIAPGTALLSVDVVPADENVAFELRFAWELGERQTFPWAILILSEGKRTHAVLKGPCAPAASSDQALERWSVALPRAFGEGTYSLTLLLYDHTLAAWQGALPPEDRRYVLRTIDLGTRQLVGGRLVPP